MGSGRGDEEVSSRQNRFVIPITELIVVYAYLMQLHQLRGLKTITIRLICTCHPSAQAMNRMRASVPLRVSGHATKVIIAFWRVD